MPSNNIPNAVIGGILTALGTQLYNKTHNHPLNFSEVFWTFTTFKQKNLVQTLPLVAGIFITSGILFDWMQYQSFGKMEPYGPSQAILSRSSMYGFAISGFCQGIGSRLIGGDLVFFGVSQILKKNCMFLGLLVWSFVSAMLVSLLLDSNSIDFLSNTNINPHMEFMHMQSANITIGLGVILIIITSFLMKYKDHPIKVIFKRVGVRFLSGALLAFGCGVCGLTNRNLVFSGLTPGIGWDPVLLVYLSTTIISNLAIHTLFEALQVKQKATVDSGLQQQQRQNRNLIHHRINFFVGGVLIGIGWGIGGLDILAYLMHSAIFTIPIVIFFGGFLILGTTIGQAINH